MYIKVLTIDFYLILTKPYFQRNLDKKVMNSWSKSKSMVNTLMYADKATCGLSIAKSILLNILSLFGVSHIFLHAIVS